MPRSGLLPSPVWYCSIETFVRNNQRRQVKSPYSDSRFLHTHISQFTSPGSMDGRKHTINLSPYFPETPSPLGLQSRRSVRHSFVSKEWGLQGYYEDRKSRAPLTAANPQGMAPSTSWSFETGLQRLQRGRDANSKPAEETRPDLDNHVGVLKVEITS
ncbi:hypothetical protein N656DRAFT_150341 [Canariomyces notabilis]|uniref:Uncharacterized protein n=1 Tax=Canariomyces notabilis TaxID=2074819 RepID=A0AAN6TCD6_9PEZI|nr:hypothetical protein N656DRAFT_150341 [Canariomyces arenarius]